MSRTPNHVFTYALYRQRLLNVPVPPPGDYELRHVDRFFPVFCERLALNTAYRDRFSIRDEGVKVDIEVSFRTNTGEVVYRETVSGRTLEEARRGANFAVIQLLYKEGHVKEVALENHDLRKAPEIQERAGTEAALEEQFRQKLLLNCVPEADPEPEPESEVEEEHETQPTISSSHESSQHTTQSSSSSMLLPVDLNKFDCLGFCKFKMIRAHMCEHQMRFLECIDCKTKFDFYAALFKRIIFSEQPFESGVTLALGELPHDELMFIFTPGQYAFLVAFKPINDREIRCFLYSGIYKSIQVYQKEQLDKARMQPYGPLSFLYRK